MRRTLLLAFLLATVLCSMPAEAKRNTHFPVLDWGLRAGVAGTYNDNVLRLSGPDQGAFRRYDASFRTPLETIDDGETELSLAPSVQWRAPAELMVFGNYRFKAVQRAKNDKTNYQTHSLSATVRPRVRGYRWAAKASVFVIPSFYLRVYRDRDFGTYDDARFANWEYNGEFSYRPVESLWLAAQAGYGTYYYGAKFTEFDTNFDEYGVELRYATPWKPSASFRYTRRISDNIGKTQSYIAMPSFDSNQILEDNEYGDGDNNEDEFRFSLHSPIRIINSVLLDGSLSTRLRRRVYTTDRSISTDPFHRGRLDNRWDVSPVLTWSVNSTLDVDASFTYEQRDSKSDVPGVAQVKNFVRREFGLGCTVKIK